MTSTVAAAAKKTFVLDTNVVLHDSDCFRCFEEHDVIIPLAVLEELDRFKRGSADINFHAREFLRSLDELTGDVLAPKGVSLGEGRGRLRVLCVDKIEPEVQNRFHSDCIDHRILSVALAVQKSAPERRIILVTKDTNLRMKAKSLGLVAQDFTADRVLSLDHLYSGQRLVENIPTATISSFYDGSGNVPLRDVGQVEEPVANENFILRNGSKSVLASYRCQDNTLRRVRRQHAFGIGPRNAEQSFALQALTDDAIQLVTLTGKAGTGKTLLALAAALECRARYRQILLARPIVPLSNRDLGFLPGDAESKITPFMQPLFDNLNVIRNHLGDKHPNAARIDQLKDREKLIITPLAYIRGRTLPRVFFVVDEAQNLTPHEIKTIITRAGEGSKIVLTGDVFQIDQPYLDPHSNGLSYLINRMKGQEIYAHVALTKGERSELSNLASELL